MKSGFLLSDNPKVSLLSQKSTDFDESLGHRKYKYDDFDFERNVGTGNFCSVWHVSLKSSPFTSYAIKSFNINFVKQERSALLALNSPGHPNVIRLIDTFKDSSNVYLIYEFAEFVRDNLRFRLELWDFVRHSGVIYDDLARYFILQIVQGLEYVHSKGIVHRDLKCENVVISGKIAKIIDFGTSKFVQSNNKASGKGRVKRLENYVGTPNFMDPQSVMNKDSGFKRDFWSLGCLIYQILCGRPPFYGSTEYFVLNRITDFDLIFPESIHPEAKNLVKSLLTHDPETRLDFTRVKSHPYLAQDTEIDVKLLMESGREIRAICCRIGKMLLELEEARNSKPSEGFMQRFNSHIDTLEKQSEESVRGKVVDLMLWSLSETTREIESETVEAKKWLP